MSRLEIEQIPVLNDNYVYLAHDPETQATGVVDPAVVAPVMEALERRGWRLTHILNTHHHADHTGGNLEIKQATGCTVVGPRADAHRIPGIDVQVGEGDTVRLGDAVARVFDVPGHTSGHIAYWFEDSDALFCGDTIFSLGCGRMFEGTPEQFWDSLSKLRALPDDTRVYCAHEYTQANLRFSLSVDPDNTVLRDLGTEIERLRAENRPTVPSLLGVEKAANPFLRADDPALADKLGLAGAAPERVFAEVRARKDSF
ncbi:hydroxyacylglutathione hydrolase [Caenispirillum salinarum]|uniref:hydroxyacylglutathione hydrolase n=1 Tax=Caenispirillum salinarum TaxID=859058 RepID=UPI00384BF818